MAGVGDKDRLLYRPTDLPLLLQRSQPHNSLSYTSAPKAERAHHRSSTELRVAGADPATMVSPTGTGDSGTPVGEREARSSSSGIQKT